MENLNFYTVDLMYVDYLKEEEKKHRGFTRVPDLDYGKTRKGKFLTGIVLEINNVDYYVPVSSFKLKKPDNFIICSTNGSAVSSLRFNYMFPVPKSLVAIRSIKGEADEKYRRLLSQELRYCIKNQETIRRLARRTYNRVLLGKDPGLLHNSCDFLLLESACKSYMTEAPS